MTGMKFWLAGSVLTGGSLTLVREIWYERPTLDNCEKAVLRMNSESGALAKTDAPMESRVKRFSSATFRKSTEEPRSPCCAWMFPERNVPSPKNFCEKAKIEKPTVIGRFFT